MPDTDSSDVAEANATDPFLVNGSAFPRVEAEGLVIVLVGEFDLSKLHPEWLRAQGLIAPDEADAAEVEIVHRDAAAFVVPEAFGVDGSRERVFFQADRAAWYDSLRDLVLGIVRLWPTTGLRAVGINRLVHVPLEQERRVTGLIGAMTNLGPLEFLAAPSVRALHIQSERTDGFAGQHQLRVEPSVLFKNSLFMSTNDHIELRPRLATDRSITAERVLDELWQTIMNRANSTFVNILALES